MFCRILRIPVLEVKYFQFANPCGYVVHEKVSNPFKAILVSLGPFFFNTIIGIIILTPAAVEMNVFRSFNNPISILAGWLGASILMHAFPSMGDADALYKNILKYEQVNIVTKLVSAPIIALVFICSIGSIAWLDLIYAVMVVLFLPKLLVGLF